jgi:maltooligosyltrehalose trehalohydrolase
MAGILRTQLVLFASVPNTACSEFWRIPLQAMASGSCMTGTRRLPVGAEVFGSDGVHFRVWAPKRRRVEVVLDHDEVPVPVALEPEAGGYFARLVPAARPGMRYRFRLDGDRALFPDPASRFQPDGPHGPSLIIDPHRFEWSERHWRGKTLGGQIIYEMHIGTFTLAGTWAAAARELPELAVAGITVLEIMPVADFPGRFGWGYDGVNLFAPTRLYGTPDDFRRFVNDAHAVGLGVILDVVYNHVGPDGNYLGQFSDDFITKKYDNEWGDALNFDGDNAGPVREFFIANARYWIDEFHLDGLRLDATQQIFDASPVHILAEVTHAAREAAGERSVLIVAENEWQETRLVRSRAEGGFGMDGLWNDDFHHSAMVALTGHTEAYYNDFHGNPQEFISAVKWGYLFQGQRYRWQKKRRGTPALDLPPAHFVTFLENHDQVANSARGLRSRYLTSPGRHKAMTALVLLAPGTPMLFQGQEFAASAPFIFFADHHPELAQLVQRGRRDFLCQFPSITAAGGAVHLPDPHDPRAFEQCKLDFTERETNRDYYDLHRDLLRLRRDDPAFSAQRPRGIDGAVLGTAAFMLRYFVDGGDDRLLVVNLGRDLELDPAPEPLLAPSVGQSWAIRWSSEDARYGGRGTAPLETDEGWRIPGEAAVVLVPEPFAMTNG